MKIAPVPRFWHNHRNQYSIMYVNHITMHIFISYSSKNRDLVTELAADIDVLIPNCIIWFDRELARRGGQEWWKVICTEIRRCDVFLVAYSPHVLASEPCRREYSYARLLGKPILPVQLIDLNYLDLPREIQAVQIVDYRQRTRDQQHTLRDSLRQMPPTPPLPANAVELEPAAPLDPIGVLRDRIATLTIDPDQQKQLLADIEFIDDDHATEIPDLLRRLLDRDDVLVGRLVKRAQDTLTRLTIPSSATPITIVTSSRRVLKLGDTRTDPKGVLQVYVPPGHFLMGSNRKHDKDAQRNEQPRHEVHITQGFWFDQYPTTNAYYQAFVNDGGYRENRWWSADGLIWRDDSDVTAPKDNHRFIENPMHPRIGINWYEAEAYANWRRGRLPTEAEWEYAARGEKSLIYPWGDAYDDRYLNSEGRIGTTTPVDAYPNGKSWCGMFDMSGNIWEWCADWYVKDFYIRYEKDETADNPICLIPSEYRVLRGGSWLNDFLYCRAASRGDYVIYPDDDEIGCRIVTAAVPVS